MREIAPALHAARFHRLAAIASRTPGKAAPFAAPVAGFRIHDRDDALPADPKIDAVYVPLPHVLHVGWGMRAFESDKHALVKKLLAMRAADIAPLIEVRDRTGLVPAAGYGIVHHPQWGFTRRLLADGAVGRLRRIEGLFACNDFRRSREHPRRCRARRRAARHRRLYPQRGAGCDPPWQYRIGSRTRRAGPRLGPRPGVHGALGQFHAPPA